MWQVKTNSDYSDSNYRTSTPIATFNPKFVQGEETGTFGSATCQTEFDTDDLSESGTSSLQNYFCSSDSGTQYDSLNVDYRFVFKSSVYDISCSGIACGVRGADTTISGSNNPLEGVSEGETVSVPSGGVYAVEEVFELE